MVGLIGLRRKPRQRQQAPDLLPYRGKEFHFGARMAARHPVLDVDHADDAVARNDGNREECFVTVFRQVSEGLEARVLIRLHRDGEHLALPRHPPREAFAHPQPHLADLQRVGVGRGAQDQLVLLDQVQQAESQSVNSRTRRTTACSVSVRLSARTIKRLMR